MFPSTSDIINKDLEKRSNKNKFAGLDPDFDPNNFEMPSISEDRPAVILDYNKKNDQENDNCQIRKDNDEFGRRNKGSYNKYNNPLRAFYRHYVCPSPLRGVANCQFCTLKFQL